jgi:acyl transferase domain-containing protein
MNHGNIVRQELAIVGMACRFPGADTLDRYWDLIRSGACSIAQLPAGRLDRSLYYRPERGGGNGGKTYSTLGGVVPSLPVDGALCPDPDAHDPSHLLMLDVAAASCRDAGWDPHSPPGRVGVYIGHARTSPLPAEMAFAAHVEDCVACLRRAPAFKRLAEALREEIAHNLIRNIRRPRPRFGESGKPFLGPAMAAGLVARSLGLTGPHLVVDAACASSLVALALAAGALEEGRIDAAVVGGASFSNWQSLALFSRAQALSASGSFPFDERADGFISSDGYASIIVKTLERARGDGDRVHAVIRGIGLSSDGRGRSLWAPRKEGQVEAIRRAYGGGVDPSRVQYIEAHGTSTPLGDATELQSLAEVLGPALRPGQRIPIGSVKGNIGHTCESAGLAGLLKAVLAIGHGVIPPAAGFARPNPEIDMERLPFVIPTEAMDWPRFADEGPRRAAVDAFGIGGLNVHVVVDAPAPGPKRAPAGPRQARSADEGHIAVIGAGAVFPGARTAAAFWEMLASGTDPKTTVPAERWDPDIYWNPEGPAPWRSPSRVGGFISGFRLDPARFRIPPRQMETSDPLQYMVLDAADQALGDAGYDARPFDRRRVAVVVGTMFCNDFTRNLTVALQYPEFERELERLLREREVPEPSIREILPGARALFHQYRPMLRDETGSFSASTLASRVARTLDLMGGAFSLDAEEASSGAALDAAATLLRSGACDMVLCAGAQRAMDVGIYEEYALKGMVTSDDSGLLPAEGTGVLLLKRAADARRDGDRVRAVIREVGHAMTGKGVSADPVAVRMGHALGASGMAAVLGALGPAGPPAATVTITSLRGSAYGIDLEKDPAPRRPRIAFLFPGQGSQYEGMLRELVRESPAAAARVREIDSLMKRLGYPTFSEIAWETGGGLGTDPWQTQVAMLLADVIVLSVLTDRGLRPDVVAGHSYGEFPALVAAGALTLEDAIRATRIRADLVRSSRGGPCRLLATNAPAETAGRIIETSGLPVHVAIRNAPGQTVLGAAQGDLDRLVPLLEAGGYRSTPLPMPGAFHTPLFEDMTDPFLGALAGLPVAPPGIPLLSGVTLRYVAEPDEIRDNLARQPSHPLDFEGMVRRLDRDGVTAFVEVGPRQVLSGLIRRILGKNTVAVACDTPSRPGLDSFLGATARLGERGAEAPADGERRPAAAGRTKHETLHFDATLRRRERNLRRGATPSPDAAPPAATPPPASAGTELSAFLVQFVCEQTGYAREVVDLDADLEADLGIDSIKKMQLFSELRDRFDFGALQPSALADFPTLRHVLDFLERNATALEPGARPAASAPAPEAAALRVLRLRGEPRRMGREQGRLQAAAIREVVQRYGEALGNGVTERADFRALQENLESFFSPSGLEELRGLAEGSGLPLEILAGLNVALMPELLPGCTHFAVKGGPPGLLHAINEDAPLLLTMGRPLPPTALARHPEGKIPHLTFVLPGQFTGINGVNARGVSVSSTLLLDRMRGGAAPAGRLHCDLIREVLEGASTIDEAVGLLRAARPLGAWGVLIGHRETGDFRYLEYDEEGLALLPPSERFVGANHALLTPPREGGSAPRHSIDRLNRLAELLDSGGEAGLTLPAARAAMRDCQDPIRKRRAERPTMHTVRRVDNLMSLVMCPGNREAWVAPGGRTETYQRLDLNELLDPRIMRRWVLRAVESPDGDAAPIRLEGAALVVGRHPAAQALARRLEAAATGGVERRDTPEQALARPGLDGDTGPAPHLFLMSCLEDPPPDILSLYGLCQGWTAGIRASGAMGYATLTAAVSLGGDFGLSGHVGSAESGGVAGLLKAIGREFPALGVKIIDSPRNQAPDRLAEEILNERSSSGPEIEIGYRFGKRYALRAIERPAVPGSPVPFTRGGVWIATGGGSGITAYAARALAERYDLRMHVLGRRASADLPFAAGYRPCDVSDRAALVATLERIRREAGPIRGILHGAGVESAARFEQKEPEGIRTTIASKADGARHLAEATRQDPLEAFIAFGSVSGRFGGHGQTDYALANEMLAKIVQKLRRERPECASVHFHWPAWDDIGMAMRPESRAALELTGQGFMPPGEGVGHLLAELEAGAPEGEILILDRPGAVALDASIGPALRLDRPLPLIEGLLDRSPGGCAADVLLDPVCDPFLSDHLYRGMPLLPAAAGLEALLEGSALLDAPGPAVLRDVEIHHGLSFGDRGPKRVRLEVTRSGDRLECRLVGEFRGRNGNLVDPERILVTGRIVREDTPAPPAVSGAPPEKRFPVHYPKSGPLVHGEALQCLRELALEEAGGAGVIIARRPGAAGGMRQGEWCVPLAELDGCLVACGAHVLHTRGALALPRRFDRLRIFRPPADGEACVVRFRERARENGTATYDFTLTGAEGEALLQAEGFGLAVPGQGGGL